MLRKTFTNAVIIPLSISILRIMHILSTKMSNAKLDVLQKFGTILKLATDDKCLEVSIPAIELLRNHGSSLQLLSLADDIRSAMLKGVDKLTLQKNVVAKQTLESYNLVDLSIRQFACIILHDQAISSDSVQEYMKLLSADGRVIKILRQALLSSNKSTVGIAMEILYTILDAGKKQMPELSHFSDFGGNSNRDLDKDDRSLKAESTEQIKALEEILETKKRRDQPVED